MKTAALMGDWWLAASSVQGTHAFITSPAGFSGEISSCPGDSAPYSQIWLLACPKTKTPLKRKRFQTVNEFQENMMRQLMLIITKGFAECFEQWKRCWKNCGRSQDAYFEGDWGIIVLFILFIVSWSIFFNKCLYFSVYMAGYFLDKPSYVVVGT